MSYQSSLNDGLC